MTCCLHGCPTLLTCQQQLLPELLHLPFAVSLIFTDQRFLQHCRRNAGTFQIQILRPRPALLGQEKAQPMTWSGFPLVHPHEPLTIHHQCIQISWYQFRADMPDKPFKQIWIRTFPHPRPPPSAFLQLHKLMQAGTQGSWLNLSLFRRHPSRQRIFWWHNLTSQRVLG